MLGVRADALDIVQDAYVQWCRVDVSGIHDAKAWLVTVCTRLAVNALHSARARRESYVGTWLPEPALDVGSLDAAAQSEIDESVSMALLLALDRLTPTERASLLLHEIFGFEFGEIAAILGKDAGACRKLASRARARVRADRPRFDVRVAEHERLISAFFAAVRGGDAAQLRSLLCESVELHADGGGKVEAVPDVLRGAAAVGDLFMDVWRKHRAVGTVPMVTPHWFNGAPGALVREHGVLTTALSVAVGDGVIHRIYALRNPDKLRGFDGASGPPRARRR